MKGLRSLIFISILTNSASFSCPLGIDFYSQIQVDSFQSWYPNCKDFIHVNITGDDIVNLKPLDAITEVHGYLTIKECNVTSLAGLENIHAIGRGLILRSNPHLKSVNEMNKLTFAGSIEIKNCPALKIVDGFGALVHVGPFIQNNSLNFQDNDSLKVISAFEKLKYLDGNIRLENNSQLETILLPKNITRLLGGLYLINNPSYLSLADFLHLTAIEGGLFVQAQHQFENLSGFNNLETVGELDIRVNSILSSLDGLEKLRSVNNDVVIFRNDLLSSLRGFRNLRSVHDILVFDLPYLRSVDGLNNIDSIHGNLNLRNNALLEDLTDLGGLKYIGGSLTIDANRSLQTLKGLENVIHVSSIFIKGNEQLENVIGLINVRSLKSILYIGSNPSLTSLKGLGNLSAVGTLTIDFNNALVNIEGLNQLRHIADELRIFNNASLLSLNKLEAINTASMITIASNPNLVSIQGLQNICFQSIRRIQITDNNNLGFCSLSNFCNAINNGAVSNINGNDSGCNFAGEILSFCTTPERTISDDIQVLPQPAGDFIKIKCSFDYEVMSMKIINVFGSNMMKTEAYHNSVDISHLPPGFYVAQIELVSQYGKDIISRVFLKN